jgi:hypothetical protein
MDYRKHYNALIDRSKNRSLTGYTEKHHIIPKCVGGDDSSNNIAILTPEEHYVAHQLLVKIYNVESLIYAANMMTIVSNKHPCRNNKLYGWLRRRLQFAAKQRTGNKNSSYGRFWFHNPNSLESGKYIPGTEPQGWSRGRVSKQINKCNGCGVNTNTPLQHWCDNCRPKTKQTVFKNIKEKSEFTEEEKIAALITHNMSIRRALLSLGLNDSGAHYKVMKKLKASLAQLD